MLTSLVKCILILESYDAFLIGSRQKRAAGRRCAGSQASFRREEREAGEEAWRKARRSNKVDLVASIDPDIQTLLGSGKCGYW